MKNIMFSWIVLIFTVLFSANLQSQSTEELQEQIEALDNQIS